ncbi:hypothetical protein D3C73_1054880 [compost metagenome]
MIELSGQPFDFPGGVAELIQCVHGSAYRRVECQGTLRCGGGIGQGVLQVFQRLLSVLPELDDCG